MTEGLGDAGSLTSSRYGRNGAGEAGAAVGVEYVEKIPYI